MYFVGKRYYLLASITHSFVANMKEWHPAGSSKFKLRHLEKLSDFRLKGVWYFKVTQLGLVSIVDILPVDHCGDPAGRSLLQRGQHLPLSHHQDGLGARHAQPVKIDRIQKKKKQQQSPTSEVMYMISDL